MEWADKLQAKGQQELAAMWYANTQYIHPRLSVMLTDGFTLVSFRDGWEARLSMLLMHSLDDPENRVYSGQPVWLTCSKTVRQKSGFLGTWIC